MIAIENIRLFESRAAAHATSCRRLLEYQTATGEISNVISIAGRGAAGLISSLDGGTALSAE